MKEVEEDPVLDNRSTVMNLAGLCATIILVVIGVVAVVASPLIGMLWLAVWLPFTVALWLMVALGSALPRTRGRPNLVWIVAVLGAWPLGGVLAGLFLWAGETYGVASGGLRLDPEFAIPSYYWVVALVTVVSYGLATNIAGIVAAPTARVRLDTV